MQEKNKAATAMQEKNKNTVQYYFEDYFAQKKKIYM